MSRQDANAAFALTSFLYGGNAAYIEELYARYQRRSGVGRCRVAAFFQSLKDEPRRASAERQRPVLANGRTGRRRAVTSWSRRSTATGARSRRRSATRSRPRRRRKGVELASADVQQATRDSVRALMLIRAYRMRGHLHANLDPLGLEPPKNEAGARSALLRLHRRRLDRPIFLDKVLGLEFATLREILAILRRTYCQTLGVEFMHISDPAQKGWMQERIEGPDKEITFTPRASAPSSTS